jgi:hypothetical protein
VQTLPRLPINQIAPTRKVARSVDFNQFMAQDYKWFQEHFRTWVRDTTKLGHREILDAGNPKFAVVQVNGTTGKAGRQRSGFIPGTIDQANNSARILYQGNELAEVANGMRNILFKTIRARFPNSKMKRLERDWVFYLMRASDDGKYKAPIYLGGRVGVAINVNDRLILVPDAPDPASYAWIANWQSKRMAQTWNLRRRKDRAKVPRDRREGYLGAAARQMRQARVSGGVSVWAGFIRKGLTSAASRSKKGYGIPAIFIQFAQLKVAVLT